jgi:1-aminocyclopropane-1-carboxylate deaminase/D-cysteine desulfhydrase-like pyridoxal-dependent ACC family enzyme
MKRALLLCLLLACSKKQEAPKQQKVAPMSATEIQRSQDACTTYVDKICACAGSNASLADQCNLAKALPDAIRIGVEVSQSADSKPKDIYGAQESVRMTAKNCVEQLAKLPSLGCP